MSDEKTAGPRDVAFCPFCGEASKVWDMEVEVELTRESGEVQIYRVHSRCFAAWDLERYRVR